MRRAEIASLFDYSYWANRQVLAAAANVATERFTAPSDVTWRGLRGTLVHLLDVERSWRWRITGEPAERWNASLNEDDFPTAASLAAAFAADEVEMRAWLDTLDDDQLTAVVDLGGKDRFPLWYFLVHIFTHSLQQRRDAALLLEQAGQSPDELEFLYYADWLRERENVTTRAHGHRTTGSR